MLARPALNWLLGHRESDFGWGTQTPRALLALLRSGSNVAGWDPATLEGQLSVKQLDNELLCHLVRYPPADGMKRPKPEIRLNLLSALFVGLVERQRNRTAGQDISRIAQYVLTLSALCRPAKDFYGIDLIGKCKCWRVDVYFPFVTSCINRVPAVGRFKAAAGKFFFL